MTAAAVLVCGASFGCRKDAEREAGIVAGAEELPPSPVLLEAPIVVDQAMLLRDWAPSIALYADGAVVAGPTGQLFQPDTSAEVDFRAHDAVVDPAIAVANSFALPVMLILNPPWSDEAYESLELPPTYYAMPPLVDIPLPEGTAIGTPPVAVPEPTEPVEAVEPTEPVNLEAIEPGQQELTDPEPMPPPVQPDDGPELEPEIDRPGQPAEPAPSPSPAELERMIELPAPIGPADGAAAPEPPADDLNK